MILFFNLDVLEKQTKGDPNYLVIALYKFFKGEKVPRSRWDKYPPIKTLVAGAGFLLQPDQFFNDKNTDIVHKAQYIRLAGRRDYTLYKTLGTRYLDLSFYPDLDLANLKSNPLLTIANNTIKFKFEE